MMRSDLRAFIIPEQSLCDPHATAVGDRPFPVPRFFVSCALSPGPGHLSFQNAASDRDQCRGTSSRMSSVIAQVTLPSSTSFSGNCLGHGASFPLVTFVELARLPACIAPGTRFGWVPTCLRTPPTRLPKTHSRYRGRSEPMTRWRTIDVRSRCDLQQYARDTWLVLLFSTRWHS